MKEIVIHCIFDGRKGTGEFIEMGKFCLKEGIQCVIRPFSHEYDEDREEIVRLPAYHIYYRNEYELTFYPGDCPEATLEEIQHKQGRSWMWPLGVLSLLSVVGKVHVS